MSGVGLDGVEFKNSVSCKFHWAKEPAGDGQLCSMTNKLAASVSSLSSVISSKEGEPMDRTRINADA